MKNPSPFLPEIMDPLCSLHCWIWLQTGDYQSTLDLSMEDSLLLFLFVCFCFLLLFSFMTSMRRDMGGNREKSWPLGSLWGGERGGDRQDQQSPQQQQQPPSSLTWLLQSLTSPLDCYRWSIHTREKNSQENQGQWEESAVSVMWPSFLCAPDCFFSQLKKSKHFSTRSDDLTTHIFTAGHMTRMSISWRHVQGPSCLNRGHLPRYNSSCPNRD